MGKTSIEWTDASWNPIVGCSETSPGCANCYAARLAATRLKNTPQYKGLAIMHNPLCEPRLYKPQPRWTGEVRNVFELDPKVLEEPLHWKKPRRIFVCDMGDLFHESVHGDWIDKVLAMIDKCPQHTFQILTKRANRMHDLLRHYAAKPNAWLGVSVENQHFADERKESLRGLAAHDWLTWVSYEPALGGVNWIGWQFVKWIVSGGESGPKARPSHPNWHRYTRDYCQQHGIAYFFKQWGAYCGEIPNGVFPLSFLMNRRTTLPGGQRLFRVGKKKAGRLLDGMEHNAFPDHQR